MQTEDNATNGLVVRSKLPLRERLASSKALLLIIAISLIVGAIGGFAGVVISLPLASMHAYGLAMFFAALAGVLIGLGAILALQGMTHLSSSKRRKIMALQRKIMETESVDLCADLQTLVKGFLELKQYQVADFYSTKLLQQSALPPEQRANKLTEMIMSTGCWVSTPAYHKSPNYWMLWLYQSRGELTITPHRLEYSSRRISFDIDLADLRDIKSAHHSRWLKPVEFRYLVLTFIDHGVEQTLFVTPSMTEADTIFEVNKQVDAWLEIIPSAREKRVASRAIEKMKAQIPGVESSSEQKV